jgi:hypothetical protein
VAKPFLHIYTKNGLEYGSIYTPNRINGVKDNNPLYLGRIVDKERFIFKNKKIGIFHYSLETGKFTKLGENKPSDANILSTMSFGDVFVVHSLLEKLGYLELFRDTAPHSPDTLISYILFRTLSEKPDSHALSWWKGSFAQVLYPKANMNSQYLSEYLAELGYVNAHHEFLGE